MPETHFPRREGVSGQKTPDHAPVHVGQAKITAGMPIGEGGMIDAQEMELLREKVHSAYDTSTDIRYAAARLWVDGIINPDETRATLIRTLEIVTRHADDEPFRTGVLQV